MTTGTALPCRSNRPAEPDAFDVEVAHPKQHLPAPYLPTVSRQEAKDLAVKPTRTLLTALLFAPLAGLSAAETSLPVFLLVGQSNMTGADSESSATIPGSESGDKRVLFWNRAAWNGVEWENDSEFHPLRVQKTGGYCADIIGPEFAFAREMQRQGGLARLAIVKVSFPGSDLAVDWCKEPAMGQRAYAALQEEMAQVRQALAARHERPAVTAILIHQGISDAATEAKAAAYETHLRRFIAQLRADFAQPATPIVLACENASPRMKPELMKQVRATIVRVAESTPRTAWINVDDLDRVKGHHFTAAAQMEIGQRYATALLGLLAKSPRPATSP
jgi:hypothetical protein